MIRSISILFFIFLITSSYAQDVVFKVEVTSDTLYFGNTIGIKYTIENAQGDFEPPQFNGLEVVGGPNVSSQFSMINGTVSQSSSYEYFLMPIETGSFYVDPAILKQEGSMLRSESLRIEVVDNPHGIRQDYRSYGVAKELNVPPLSGNMTKADSLRLKLKNIKATKI